MIPRKPQTTGYIAVLLICLILRAGNAIRRWCHCEQKSEKAKNANQIKQSSKRVEGNCSSFCNQCFSVHPS